VPDETDLQKLAEYALKFFQSKKRREARDDDDIYYFMAERIPKWIYDMVYAVHEDGRWIHDDHKYLYIIDALNYLSEGNNPETPELEADVYTSDLIKWLGSHNFRTIYVDDAVKLHGWDEQAGIEGALAWGQIAEREEVFGIVLDKLNDRLEEISKGVRETFLKPGGNAEGVMDWKPTE